MKNFLLFFFILGLGTTSSAQFKASTDAIFNNLHLKFSKEALDNAKQEYELANDTIKAIMLKVYSMPMSSRKELLENYELHKNEIADLKNEFCNSIPEKFIVSLEIETADNPLHTIKNIDLQIFKQNKNGNLDFIDGEWGLQFDSDRFYALIHIIGWDAMSFSNIKNLMQMANCISILNGKQTEIGFARSGLGKYSYLIFPTKLLTVPEIVKYNDGCNYIYYKENVVFMYEGGMAGPQCFTD